MVGFLGRKRFARKVGFGGFFILIVLVAGGYCSAVRAGGALMRVKERGILIAGVKDSAPPFGFMDEKSHMLVGYDVDFCRAIAKRLGVRLELKPVTSATRIPQLIAGNIDLIAATMIKTPDRARQIDFSYPYYLTGQKFLVRQGTASQLADLGGKAIGIVAGSTAGQNVLKICPSAFIISFNDSLQAFIALRQSKVVAMAEDETVLAGLLAKAPDGKAFAVLDFTISDEPYGLGVCKGDPEFLDFVNATLLQMEKSGEAGRIFGKWFGLHSGMPRQRTFAITAVR